MIIIRFLLILIFLSASVINKAQQKVGFILNGELDGLNDYTSIYLVRNKMKGVGADTISRTFSMGGKFMFSGHLPYEGTEHFIFFDNSNYKQPLSKIIILLENRNILLKGKVDMLIKKQPNQILQSLVIDGSSSHDDYVKFKKDEGVLVDSLNNILLQKQRSEKQISDSDHLAINQQMAKFSTTWINNHLNSMFTPYVIYTNKDANSTELNDAYNKLTTKSKNSYWGNKLKARIEMLKHLDVGKKMPDFKFPTPEGDLLSLSEIVGKSKLTLIDFWASWCKPCIELFPELKNIYQKYNSRGLSIVGYSSDKDAVAWKNTIQKFDLPWYNVRQNLEGYSRTKYDITLLPTTILIDEQGRVIGTYFDHYKLKEKIAESLGE